MAENFGAFQVKGSVILTSRDVIGREVLTTDVDKIRSLAPKIKRALDKDYLTVVGGKSAIAKEAELLNVV